jgi:hypothetical protein
MFKNRNPTANTNNVSLNPVPDTNWDVNVTEAIANLPTEPESGEFISTTTDAAYDNMLEPNVAPTLGAVENNTGLSNDVMSLSTTDLKPPIQLEEGTTKVESQTISESYDDQPENVAKVNESLSHVSFTSTSPRRCYLEQSIDLGTNGGEVVSRRLLNVTSLNRFVDTSSKKVVPRTPILGPNRQISVLNTPSASRYKNSPVLPGIMAVQTRSPFSGGRVIPSSKRGESEVRNDIGVVTPMSYIKTLNATLQNSETEGIFSPEEKQMSEQQSIQFDEKWGNFEDTRKISPSVLKHLDSANTKYPVAERIVGMEFESLVKKDVAAVTPGEAKDDARKTEHRHGSTDGEENNIPNVDIHVESPFMVKERIHDKTPKDMVSLPDKGFRKDCIECTYNKRNHTDGDKTPPSIITPVSMVKKTSLQTSSGHTSLPPPRTIQVNRRAHGEFDMHVDRSIGLELIEPSTLFEDEYQVFLDKLRDYSDKEQFFRNTLLDMTVHLSMKQTSLLEVEAKMMDLTKELEQLLETTNASMEAMSNEINSKQTD